MPAKPGTRTRPVPNTLVLMFALEFKRQLDEGDAAYAEAVDTWYSHGEGRPRRVAVVDDHGNFVALARDFSDFDREDVHRYNFGGEGHRFPYCRHGADLWVDWDVICGECEFDETTNAEKALRRAHNLVDEFNRRSEVATAVREATFGYLGHSEVNDAFTKVRDWAFSYIDADLKAIAARRAARDDRRRSFAAYA